MPVPAAGWAWVRLASPTHAQRAACSSTSLSERITMPTPVAHVCAALALLLVAGCGSSSVPADTVSRVRLEDVFGLYKAHVEKVKRPPTKLSQLEPWEPVHVNGYAAVNEGLIVVL